MQTYDATFRWLLRCLEMQLKLLQARRWIQNFEVDWGDVDCVHFFPTNCQLAKEKTQLIPLQQHNSVKSFFLLFLLLKRARQIFSWVSFTSMFFTTEGWFSGCNLVSQSINLGLGVWLIQTVNQSSQALFSYIGPYHCYLQSLCIKHWINTSMKNVLYLA